MYEAMSGHDKHGKDGTHQANLEVVSTNQALKVERVPNDVSTQPKNNK